MNAMEFRYINAKGEASTQRLKDGWKESGKYIDGYSLTDQGPRSFLIYRVTEYLNGSERLLRDPFQAAPEKVTKQSATEILFTGFLKAERAQLEQTARDAGMKVVKSVTKGLRHLCVGANAGPSKVEPALERGLFILTATDLMTLIETGELPDCAPDFLHQLLNKTKK